MDKQPSSVGSYFSCFKKRLSSRDDTSQFTEDERARRRFALVGMVIGMVSQVSFFVVNFFFTQVKVEAFFDMATAVMFFLSFVLMCRKRLNQWAFRLGVSTLLVLCTYTLFFEHNEFSGIVLGFFFFPIFNFYLLGFKEGLLWLLPFGIIVGLVGIAPGVFDRPPLPPIFIFYFYCGLSFLTILSGFVEYTRASSWRELLRVGKTLTDATDELEALEGFVPICSYCKKIRDDQGFWNKLESFLSRNTTAELSLGVCQNCRSEDATDASVVISIPKNYKNSFRIEEYRKKRQFVIWIGLLAVVVIWLSSVRDFVNGYTIKGIVQVAIGGVFLVNALLLWKNKVKAVVYHITVVAAVLLFVQPFLGANPEAPEIIWFLIMPLITAHLLGWKEAVFWCIGLYIFVVFVFLQAPFLSPVSYSPYFSVYFSLIFFVVIILSLSLVRIREHYADLIRQKILELNETYNNIKTLKGLVPVCSSCKAIRNDKGFWTDLETYLFTHTDLKLSHGICPDCLKKHNPQMYQEMLEAGELESMY